MEKPYCTRKYMFCNRVRNNKQNDKTKRSLPFLFKVKSFKNIDTNFLKTNDLIESKIIL